MKTLLLVAAAGGALWYFTRGGKAAKATKTGVASVTAGKPITTMPSITPPQWSTVPSITEKEYTLLSNYVGGGGCSTC